MLTCGEEFFLKYISFLPLLGLAICIFIIGRMSDKFDTEIMKRISDNDFFKIGSIIICAILFILAGFIRLIVYIALSDPNSVRGNAEEVSQWLITHNMSELKCIPGSIEAFKHGELFGLFIVFVELFIVFLIYVYVMKKTSLDRKIKRIEDYMNELRYSKRGSDELRQAYDILSISLNKLKYQRDMQKVKESIKIIRSIQDVDGFDVQKELDTLDALQKLNGDKDKF